MALLLKIKNKLRSAFENKREADFQGCSYDEVSERLRILSKECGEYIRVNQVTPELKILWPTFFNLNKTWWGHDGIISLAMKVRGAKIYPTMCGRLQGNECMFYAGKWQDMESPGFEERRRNLCNACKHRDESFWSIIGSDVVDLSKHISDSQKNFVHQKVCEWLKGDWPAVVWRDFPVGGEAYKSVVNNELQCAVNDEWDERAKSAAYEHLSNIMSLLIAYEKVFDEVVPDRVFGNGGFYYPWGVVAHYAKKKSCPYFRYHQIGMSKLSWNYEKDTMELIDQSGAWASFEQMKWSCEKDERVLSDLKIRGARVEEKAVSIEERENIYDSIGLDPNRPTALAAMGVAWDATSNSPSPAFGSMYDWISETIQWFEHHPEWQLIVRSHPGAKIMSHVAPNTRTYLDRELAKRRVPIPGNVVVVPSESEISTNALIAITNVGMVHTSTTGLEMACVGLPVIVVGLPHYVHKGFTYDPATKDAFYDVLSQLLSRKLNDRAAMSLMARKYFYLYAYHGSMDFGLMDALPGEGVRNMRIKELHIEDILPGANRSLDYLCESVIENKPIMGDNRWPPENAYVADACVFGKK